MQMTSIVQICGLWNSRLSTTSVTMTARMPRTANEAIRPIQSLTRSIVSQMRLIIFIFLYTSSWNLGNTA